MHFSVTRYVIVKDLADPELIEVRCDPHETMKPSSREHRTGRDRSRKELVELIGIEPTTSGLQSPRSPN